MSYDKFDVLAYLNTTSSVDIDQIKTIFPDKFQNYEKLFSCLNTLRISGFIDYQNTKWTITEKGKLELTHREEEREIRIRLTKLQLDLAESQLPVLKQQLHDYQFFKWVPIGISIISIIVSIILFMLRE